MCLRGTSITRPEIQNKFQTRMCVRCTKLLCALEYQVSTVAMASTAPVAEPVPATETAAETTKEEKPKRTYKKRKNAAPAPPPVEAATPADELKPLPEDATGFRFV